MIDNDEENNDDDDHGKNQFSHVNPQTTAVKCDNDADGNDDDNPMIMMMIFRIL